MTVIDSVSRLGGAERLAAEVAIRLDPERFERHLCLTRYSPGVLVDRAQAAGVHLLPLQRRFRFDLAAMSSLVTFLRRERIDVLHSHLLGSNLWAAVIGPLAGVPVRIAQEHSWSFVGQPLRRFADRRVVARSADVVLAVSREDSRRMIEIEGMHPSKVRVLSPGIAASSPPPHRDTRGDLGISSETPIVGMVGRLAPEKAIEVLIEAAGMLTAEFPDIRVLIVGDGGERGSCAPSLMQSA